MFCPETVHAVRSAWLKSQGVFTALDPDFGQGEQFEALCKIAQTDGHAPASQLRYLGLLEESASHAPGLHYLSLPEINIELHLWVGPAKAGLQEFNGQFDAVLHPDAQRLYSRRIKVQALKPIQPASVAVVGAGIAGSSVAWALCKKGVKVHLYDSASEPAAGASGNCVGAFHPHITRGDSPLSKLSRLGFQHTVQALKELSALGLLAEGEDWATPGHLQTVPHDEAERTQETLAMLNFPETLVRWAQPNELLPTPLGGLYFPQGGWVKPAHWVRANLKACGELLTTHFNSKVTNLQALREQHSAVVVCCAEGSIDLAPIEGAKVSSVKGQISKLRSVAQPGVVLSGESYAIAPQGTDWMVLGATYERPVVDLTPSTQADAENMARFSAAFPGWPLGELIDHRCAVRSVWHDRLPAIGPVPNKPGVYMSTGFASRGLLWAALGGWQVANYCTGHAFESKLLGKITPRAARA
ncbi:FAD-dependent 5-carboxymethylaminomethyl-2-thiouridine(34) oxidoreductase MnmC [Limnobacter parvus]|uniref:FAD-dependent 5-carboxymethylaminomethyl-2-thiouridine(34) oxidoreductase MnmC n=1 Tax=Limnobacter parvus TaxID=2939690 RepID=A0ABT1XM39_9BURK|nr:FAD-dependent 5-carboxymethylaminomethyl-2-thiouridine(34) oxidoreductase MnmC [Limnobacter parvus]MCR2747332.1 FAD-dependent 5-carboxymethylaminomethyl-2-thiouridine(34) oxidoreductase MnmC [Limnobacter parvus]